jgi:hypothetical protein
MLLDMVKEDLVAERVVIQSYTEIVAWLGNGDPTTRRILEQILAEEEEHADELLSLLQKVGLSRRSPSGRDGRAFAVHSRRDRDFPSDPARVLSPTVHRRFASSCRWP